MNSVNILHLNTDTLFEIYGYLKLKDQINFALTCSQLAQIFQEFSQFTYKTVPYLGLCTNEERIAFFRIAGEYIEACHSTENSDYFIRVVSKSMCIKRLKIECTFQNFHYLQNLKNFLTLETVNIFVPSIYNNDIANYVLNILHGLPKLKKLSLRCTIAAKNYTNIYKFTPIEKFSFTADPYTDDVALANFCTSMPNLRVFELEIFQLSTTVLRALIENCKNLESLNCEISNECEQTLFSEIPKLRFVRLFRTSKVKEVFFSALAEKRAHQLEGLDIATFPININLYFNTLDQLRYLYLELNEETIPTQPVILARLEILCIDTYDNVARFLLQILRDNMNLHLIEIINQTYYLTKEFVNECVRIREHNATNFPIYFLLSVDVDYSMLNSVSPLVQFYGEFPANIDPSLTRLYEKYSEYRLPH